MATYTNFYETIQEALMRLKNTVVMYDGNPYYIWTITDHKGDGVFRVYMTDLRDVNKIPTNVPAGNSVPHGHASMGQVMDTWMEQPSNKPFMLRKKMNSPLFNKFRPFPLGMVNQRGHAIYTVRQPVRPKTEQGLLPQAVFTSLISLSPNMKGKAERIDVFGPAFTDCILGRYPSPKEVLDGLKNPKYENESVAFHREFALIKGPIDLIFLAYREDVIGVLPNGDLNALRIGREFRHTKEAVEELNLFYNIQIQS